MTRAVFKRLWLPSVAVAALAVLAGAGSGLPPLQAQTDAPSEIVATRDVMVSARDGVHLSTDIYVPERAGPATGRFPAVVERTPYNQASTAGGLPKYFVTRGYAVVVQDVHGRYRSEGTWRPLRDDGPDGAGDLLKGISEQPWSNGKVGTVGTS